jgi:hypothetical protein
VETAEAAEAVKAVEGGGEKVREGLVAEEKVELERKERLKVEVRPRICGTTGGRGGKGGKGENTGRPGSYGQGQT